MFWKKRKFIEKTADFRPIFAQFSPKFATENPFLTTCFWKISTAKRGGLRVAKICPFHPTERVGQPAPSHPYQGYTFWVDGYARVRFLRTLARTNSQAWIIIYVMQHYKFCNLYD